MQVTLTGNKIKKGRVKNSPFYNSMRLVSLALMMMITLSVSAQTITTKVFRPDGESNYYGKLHLPKGGKYKVAMFPREGVMVGVFRTHIDGTNIYLSSVDPYGKTYWIDATEVEQNFIVRNTDGADIEAIPVSSEEAANMEANEWYYYDRSEARKNSLRYSNSVITNETLRTQSTTKGRPIYVMANPARRGLAFAYLNHEGTTRDLPAGSLYVIGKAGTAARELNVIVEDDLEAETTGIQTMNTAECRKNDKAIYTLQGVRVEKPQKGSIYISNGKKFIAR